MTFVYVIGNDDLEIVKVGIANNPRARILRLKSGCPYKVELMKAVEMKSRDLAFEIERTVHAVHADKRMAGEWFAMDWPLADEAIETAIDTYEYFSGERIRASRHYLRRPVQ